MILTSDNVVKKSVFKNSYFRDGYQNMTFLERFLEILRQCPRWINFLQAENILKPVKNNLILNLYILNLKQLRI